MNVNENYYLHIQQIIMFLIILLCSLFHKISKITLEIKTKKTRRKQAFKYYYEFIILGN